MDLLKYKCNWTVFLLIIWFHTTDAGSLKEYSKVCQSEACKNIANSILQKMNQSVSPCDNFYEYVCDNFSRNVPISLSRSQNDLLNRLRDEVLDQLKDNIENQITDKDPEAFQKLLTYYKTCMDEDQIKKTSNNEFLRILMNLGGWPVLVGKSYQDSSFNWISTTQEINKMGYSRNYFLSVDLSNDLKNNTKNVLYVGISMRYLLLAVSFFFTFGIVILHVKARSSFIYQ